ncbi:MAG: DUF5677 domain-containing protein [Actinobacteria bacterium]|nr:DUF5677 domain-containing protein [Actinomycetota bacterium]
MNNKIFEDLNNIYFHLEEFLNNYNKSEILQNYFISEFKSFFYANLINNFFINLNHRNIKEYNLPEGKIGIIKRNYKKLQQDVKLSLTWSSKNNKVDEKRYINFRLNIKKEFPEFYKIISEIEKEIDTKKVKHYLKKKEKYIKKLGKSDKDLNALFIVKALEIYIQKEKCFPIGKKLDCSIKVFVKESLPKCSQEIVEKLRKNINKMLNHQRKYQKGFENRLYQKWKEPLNLLEYLIKISLEFGMEHKDKLNKTTNNFKQSALLKIHARALQISNEILVLLKSGYADGANARWRSLHELAVISFFLLDNNNDVSRRYLEHEVIKNFKELEDYKVYYKKLGYLPIGRKEFNKIKSEKEKLCRTYSDNFQGDYGWIPSSILSNRNFRALEKYVRLDKLRPFYNLSCDAVHGGSKGFYRLGLMDNYQHKILLAGASNYGLADPIQNTVISLLQITICLLNLEHDFESIMQMYVMNNYINEIGVKAVNVQKQIEKDEYLKFTN